MFTLYIVATDSPPFFILCYPMHARIIIQTHTRTKHRTWRTSGYFFPLYVSIYLVVFSFCRCFVVFKRYFLALLYSLWMNWWNCTKNFSKAVLSSCVLWIQNRKQITARKKMFGRNHFRYSCCHFVEAVLFWFWESNKSIKLIWIRCWTKFWLSHSFLIWSNLFIFI